APRGGVFLACRTRGAPAPLASFGRARAGNAHQLVANSLPEERWLGGCFAGCPAGRPVVGARAPRGRWQWRQGSLAAAVYCRLSTNVTNSPAWMRSGLKSLTFALRSG